MKRFSKVLLMVPVIVVLGAAALAQNAAPDKTVTSEAIGSLSGGLNVQFPPDPCINPDPVTFTGNVHIVTQVNTTLNTMDVHINLMTVKGTGSNGKYVGNGAESFLDLTANPNSVVNFAGDLFPPVPCRLGFTSKGALPIAVQFTLGTDGTLSSVSASVVGQGDAPAPPGGTPAPAAPAQ